MPKCKYFFRNINCQNETSECTILPGHWLSECDVHLGKPCAIEGCFFRQEWFFDDGDPEGLRNFYDDEDDPAQAHPAPYCYDHGQPFWSEWGFCQEPGCLAWCVSPGDKCGDHGGVTYIPRKQAAGVSG